VAGLLGSDVTRSSRAIRIGGVLLGLGALGASADAIFHLVAVEMTAPGVAVEAMAPVMRALQGADLWLLAPFVIAFFAGHVAIVVASRRAGRVAGAAFRLLLSIPAIGLLAAQAQRLAAWPSKVVGLAVLAGVTGSLALVGLAGAVHRGHPVTTVTEDGARPLRSSASG
jgi:hypothetical protein